LLADWKLASADNGSVTRENLATSRLNITYLASTQKAWARPDDGQLVLALFGTETPCDGLSPNARIMFFAAAIGGRLYGKEQTQADA
jgi:hypothetical protein